jgi:hypothetical protein
LFLIEEGNSITIYGGLYALRQLKIDPIGRRSLYADNYYVTTNACFTCCDTLLRITPSVISVNIEYKEEEGIKVFSFSEFEHGCGESQEYFDSAVVNQSCPDSYFISTIGIDEASQPKINITPTLFCNELFISQPSSQSEITIVNLLGEIILRQKLDNETRINTENFISGIYIAQISDGKNIYYQKLVKQ